jgi:hypothetical protein
MLEVSPERAELIRGLFELAAFVADHAELPLPSVQASFFTGRAGWQAQCAVVDRVATALGRAATDEPENGRYTVDAGFGSVRVYSTAFTEQSMAEYEAGMSYSHSVQPEVSAVAAGGAR